MLWCVQLLCRHFRFLTSFPSPSRLRQLTNDILRQGLMGPVVSVCTCCLPQLSINYGSQWAPGKEDAEVCQSSLPPLPPGSGRWAAAANNSSERLTYCERRLIFIGWGSIKRLPWWNTAILSNFTASWCIVTLVHEMQWKNTKKSRKSRREDFFFDYSTIQKTLWTT